MTQGVKDTGLSPFMSPNGSVGCVINGSNAIVDSSANGHVLIIIASGPITECFFENLRKPSINMPAMR